MPSSEYLETRLGWTPDLRHRISNGWEPVRVATEYTDLSVSCVCSHRRSYASASAASNHGSRLPVRTCSWWGTALPPRCWGVCRAWGSACVKWLDQTSRADRERGWGAERGEWWWEAWSGWVAWWPAGRRRQCPRSGNSISRFCGILKYTPGHLTCITLQRWPFQITWRLSTWWKFDLFDKGVKVTST